MGQKLLGAFPIGTLASNVHCRIVGTGSSLTRTGLRPSSRTMCVARTDATEQGTKLYSGRLVHGVALSQGSCSLEDRSQRCGRHRCMARAGKARSSCALSDRRGEESSPSPEMILTHCDVQDYDHMRATFLAKGMAGLLNWYKAVSRGLQGSDGLGERIPRFARRPSPDSSQTSPQTNSRSRSRRSTSAARRTTPASPSGR